MSTLFEAGSRVRVIASDEHASHHRAEDLAALLGKEGNVTGRTLGELIEVRIAGAVVPSNFGYLLHPSQLEALEPEAVPDGQLCDRLKNYAVHESHSATRGPRGGRCDRKAKARDGDGTWACGVHLGADKRGEENRKRGTQRRSWKNSRARKSWLAPDSADS
jgi:hypothetical protein